MAAKNKPGRLDVDVGAELKEAFIAACDARLASVPKILRHFVRTYVEEFQREQEIREQLAKEAARKKR